MHASEAAKNYKENWDKEFTTMDALYERIKILSENGAYELQVYIDSHTTYEQVKSELRSKGYQVGDYNGGNNGILEVQFCD